MMHYHFITGKLAARSLESMVQELSAEHGFSYSVQVLPISVAALMTTDWAARHTRVPANTTHLMVPGHCQGPLELLEDRCHVAVVRGPKDLRQLPEYFGGRWTRPPDYGDHDIQILAEINHAPRWDPPELVSTALRLAADGADVIDVGCEPGSDCWSGVASCVRSLRDAGLRVSIDSLHPREIAAAVSAGAELVLSVNRSNREAAVDWGCEVVAIPDDPRDPPSLEDTLEFLDRHGVRYRIDPILEPIGAGFTASLARYMAARQRWSDAELFMGIGNLTELTDVDSAGINVLLLAVCQELQIRSVLTTQVIPWACSSVRECDAARRLVHYAVRHGVPPKHLEPDLVMLRDPDVIRPSDDALEATARSIRDRNYRISVTEAALHLMNRQGWLRDSDPFVLWQRLQESGQRVDPGHAFYLGYELCKANVARIVGKHYEQDEPLRWGLAARRSPFDFEEPRLHVTDPS